MIKDFQVIHRRKPHSFSASSPLIWETCLRSISFTADPSHVDLRDGDELFVSHHAFQFILEIICGLHSPIVGETEVFGQFKIFAKEWQRHEPRRAALIQRFFTDAKELRSRFLCGMGNQSYGGWLKRNVRPGTDVHIVGGGQLALEIAPHLQKAASSLTLHVRQPDKVKAGARVAALSEKSFTEGSLIIAAPIAAADVRSWLGGRSPVEIFDLRAESKQDPLTVQCKRLHALGDIFNEIEQTKARLLPIIDQVKNEIAARGERLASEVVVRPQGWDDICA